MQCHAMLCDAMRCHTMPCHAMSFHAKPCHAMPCRTIPYIIYQVILFSRCEFMKFVIHLFYTCMLTTFQGISEMFYSCQHFPLTVCHTMSYYIIISYQLSYHIMSFLIMPCHALPFHASPCHAMQCNVMPCHAMPCHAIPCHVMSCHIMFCHVMSRHVMSCHAMQYHTICHLSGITISRYGFMKIAMPIYYTCMFTIFQGIFEMFYSCQPFVMPYKLIKCLKLPYHITCIMSYYCMPI